MMRQRIMEMVAEMLQKSKFLSYVLYLRYMKFYFCYIFYNNFIFCYIFNTYLYVYYIILIL